MTVDLRSSKIGAPGPHRRRPVRGHRSMTTTHPEEAIQYLAELEGRVQGIYERSLLPLAKRYTFELPLKNKNAQGQPTVLMLGNHSSGKSTFINFLLGEEIQKTGLAPVDDGFTIITHGDSDDEFDGQSLVSHPRLPYRGLERFGPGLVARLRMKVRPHSVLQSITLIDSPGMIDAPDANVGRGYDFVSTVRYFAEVADLILFFFDPDKPGTTGETMIVFTQALTGLDHKLRIVLNKVDRFSNIRDFARAYGALCWNLSKVIPRKDLPHIFNMYVPGAAATADKSAEGTIKLADFDVSRDEVIDQVERAPAKRADNLVSDLHAKSKQLEMHARVCGEVAWDLSVHRWRTRGMSAALLALTAGIVALTWDKGFSTVAMIAVGGAALAAITYQVGRWIHERMERTIVAGLDAVFERIYARELTLGERSDLKGTWEAVKDRTITTLKAIGPAHVPHLFRWSQDLKRLRRSIDKDIPALRRDIASTTVK